MTITALVAVALAFGLDRLVGELPNRLHPVAWFGSLVGAADREWASSERGQRLAGVAIAALLPLTAAAAAGLVVLAAGAVHPFVGAVAAALVLFTSTSLGMLLEATRTVVVATEADLEVAREALLALAGRDASELSAAEVRSAAVESAGENLADGLVAALLPFAILAPISLPAAAAVAAWVKAVNTLDSMLGYRTKSIGTASARLDDAVMWLPARVAAFSIALAAPDPRALWRARQWARVPASPNSGWPMTTLACALGVRLEKRDAYVLNPDAELPTIADGERAVGVVGRAGWLAVGFAAVIVAIPEVVQ